MLGVCPFLISFYYTNACTAGRDGEKSLDKTAEKS